MSDFKTIEEADEKAMKVPVYVPRLLEMFDGIVSDVTVRAWMRKKRDPLPNVPSGEKRPRRKVYPAVFARYLAYIQGAVSYDEVEQAARRCAMGARQ